MDLEIRDQEHLMDAEGTSDDKLSEVEIVKEIKDRGYKALNIEIFYDDFQGFWRFSADIEKIGDLL